MANRRSLHAKLTAIMETMARSTLVQVSKLVEEDTSELQRELSRLLAANSALKEKVDSLECELTIVTSDASKLCKSSRSVGVQTGRCRDGDAHVPEPPVIQGIFGNVWFDNLWKDRDPDSVERYTDSPLRPPDKSATRSDHITVTELKEEDFLEDVAAGCQREMPQQHGRHEDILAEEAEPLSVGYLIDGSPCGLSFDEDGEQLLSAGGLEDPTVRLVSIPDTDEAFSTHIIPIEEDDDDDDDVQFIEESQQETTMDAEEPGHDDEKTLPAGDDEHGSALDKESEEEWNTEDKQFPTETQSQNFHALKFTCHICSRSFFHKGTLTRHMKSHRSNFCSICKQHFPRKSKLKSHKCVAPVAPHRLTKSCTLCGKVFANPSALRIHYVVHTGEKPYTCSLCGKSFTQKGNLKCHLRIHTGEKPYHCSKCGRTFTQKVNLNHHLIAHRNEELLEDGLEISIDGL